MPTPYTLPIAKPPGPSGNPPEYRPVRDLLRKLTIATRALAQVQIVRMDSRRVDEIAKAALKEMDAV